MQNKSTKQKMQTLNASFVGGVGNRTFDNASIMNQSFGLKKNAERPRGIEKEFKCSHKLDSEAKGSMGHLFLLEKEFIFVSVASKNRIDYSRILKVESRTTSKIERTSQMCIMVRVGPEPGSAKTSKETHYFYDLPFHDEAFKALQEKYNKSVAEVSKEGSPSTPKGRRGSCPLSLQIPTDHGKAYDPPTAPRDGTSMALYDIPAEPVETAIASIQYPPETQVGWFSSPTDLKKSIACPESALPPGTTLQTILQRVIHDASFLHNLHNSQGSTNVTMTPWSGQNCGARLLKATITVYVPLKTTTVVNQGQRFATGTRGNAKVLQWYLSSQTPDVTMGTTFRQESLMEFVEDNDVVKVTSYMFVMFTGNTWGFSGTIESSCQREVPKNFAMYTENIRKVCAAPPAVSQGGGIADNDSLGETMRDVSPKGRTSFKPRPTNMATLPPHTPEQLALAPAGTRRLTPIQMGIIAVCLLIVLLIATTTSSVNHEPEELPMHDVREASEYLYELIRRDRDAIEKSGANDGFIIWTTVITYVGLAVVIGINKLKPQK